MTACKRIRIAYLAGCLMALQFLLSASALAQESSGPFVGGDTFSGNGGQPESDQFSTNCNRGNASPYAEMDPLSCYGVMMPTDSSGQCRGAAGWQLLKQEGNTCYFCQPINPPINGVIIPLDQLNQAREEGFKCGVDQASPNCMAVCSSDAGGGSYVPPNESLQPTPAPPVFSSSAGAGGCIPPDNLTPEERAQWYQTYVLSGRIRCPGAYNPCDNPNAPSWCTSNNSSSESPSACSCADPDKPGVCDDGQSIGRRFCVRGYSADQILCGDPSQFPRGSLLNARPVPIRQQLSDWMLTDDAKSFSDSVTATVSRQVAIPRSARPPGFKFALQANILVTVVRCKNGNSIITGISPAGQKAAGIQWDASAQEFTFVQLQQKPPYFDWFMQNAINSASTLTNSVVAPLPASCPTNEVGIVIYLKNWDAHTLPGVPVHL